MHEKYVAAGFWDADLPISSVIDMVKNGRYFLEQLEKCAEGESETARKLRDMVEARHGIDPSRVYMHVITNGAMERYSANDNGDGFNEKAGEYKSPLTGKTAELAGGLTEFHDTYMQGGGVYHKHRNSRKKDPKTGRPFDKLGEIEAVAFNPRMHRGETIISVPRSDAFWEPHIEKCANGEQLFWSMGTTVPFDICSECLNKAASRAGYCSHLRESLGGLTKEGRRIMAINDRTKYHDLSLVDIPAFRIAGTLAKVASMGNLRPEFIPDDPVTLRFMNPARAERRQRLLHKLAEMEKKVPACSSGEMPLAVSLDRTCGEESEIAEKLKDVPLDVLTDLEKNHKTLLPSRTFTIILLNKGRDGLSDEGLSLPSCLSEPQWLDLIPAKLPGVFSRLLDTGLDASESCCPVCGSSNQSHRSTFSRVLPDLSTSPDAAERRIMIRVIRKPEQQVKEAQTIPAGWHEAAELAALEYARHQLDVVETCPELMKLAVLQNNAQAVAAQVKQTSRS